MGYIGRDEELTEEELADPGELESPAPAGLPPVPQEVPA